MVAPGLLAIIVPVLIGFIGGAEMLGGLLAGVTTCGVLMAIFQSNAGGAWDNAKKMIEEQGKKGTEAHKAAVVGDTVGDPFKDTSGPSLNILLKLMSVVALVIAPSIAMNGTTTGEATSSVNIMMGDENGIYSIEALELNATDEFANVSFILGEVLEGRGVEKFNNSKVSFSAQKVENKNGTFRTIGELMVNETALNAMFTFKLKGSTLTGDMKLRKPQKQEAK